MKIVLTNHSKLPKDRIICQMCNKTIAIIEDDEAVPSYQECLAVGNIPIPNLGWFCSQECGEKFERVNEIKFQRNSIGKIDYYDGKLNI